LADDMVFGKTVGKLWALLASEKEKKSDIHFALVMANCPDL